MYIYDYDATLQVFWGYYSTLTSEFYTVGVAFWVCQQCLHRALSQKSMVFELTSSHHVFWKSCEGVFSLALCQFLCSHSTSAPSAPRGCWNITTANHGTKYHGPCHDLCFLYHGLQLGKCWNMSSFINRLQDFDHKNDWTAIIVRTRGLEGAQPLKNLPTKA